MRRGSGWVCRVSLTRRKRWRGAQRERHRPLHDDTPVYARKSAELSYAASQPLDASLNLHHITGSHWSVITDAFDAHEEREPFAVFGLRQNEDGSNLRDRLGENCRRQRWRLSRLTRQVALVEGDVLDADYPFVGFELRDAINEKKWIAVRKDALDRRVVERQ